MKLTPERRQYIKESFEQNICDGDMNACMISAESVLEFVYELLEDLPDNTTTEGA